VNCQIKKLILSLIALMERHVHSAARSPRYKVPPTLLKRSVKKCLLPLMVYQIVTFLWKKIVQAAEIFGGIIMAKESGPCITNTCSVHILGIADLPLTDYLFANHGAPDAAKNVWPHTLVSMS